MKVNELKIEHVYICSDGSNTQHALYYGMSDDKYMFIPYNRARRHFNGIPFTLQETEVANLIKPLA